MPETRDHRADRGRSRPPPARGHRSEGHIRKNVLRAAGAAAVVLATGCAGPPEPREARLDRGVGERLGMTPTTVEGVFGAELTLSEIRTLHVEPRCAEAGLVMASLRVSRRGDGAQEVFARCGMALLVPSGKAL